MFLVFKNNNKYYKIKRQGVRSMNKLMKVIKQPTILLKKMNDLGIIHLSDEKYLKLIFKMRIGYELNLDNPKTFNEKLQWLKLYDRKPLYTTLVDKCKVREYIKQKIGEEYLIPLLGVYDRFDDIDFKKLPKQFVIKCNHDSGGLVICKDKKKFDYEMAKKKINKSLKSNYYYHGREWPYKNVNPKIIIEKYMEDNKVHELIDYKVMCFDGVPKMIFTCSERFSSDGLKVTFFDLNWQKLPFERHYKSSINKVEKPKNYDKMLELSRKLSIDIPFVRVDWYEINGKLYFGELTFYPGSGVEEFSPQEWDLKIGNMLNLPQGEKK